MANFLAGERSELAIKASGELPATVGARILKFDRTISGLGTLKVELWDVSGNERCAAPLRTARLANARHEAAGASRRRFEAGWPAIKHKADGVMLMYNPMDSAQANEVNLWCVLPAALTTQAPWAACPHFHSLRAAGTSGL